MMMLRCGGRSLGEIAAGCVDLPVTAVFVVVLASTWCHRRRRDEALWRGCVVAVLVAAVASLGEAVWGVLKGAEVAGAAAARWCAWIIASRVCVRRCLGTLTTVATGEVALAACALGLPRTVAGKCVAGARFVSGVAALACFLAEALDIVPAKDLPVFEPPDAVGSPSTVRSPSRAYAPPPVITRHGFLSEDKRDEDPDGLDEGGGGDLEDACRNPLGDSGGIAEEESKKKKRTPPPLAHASPEPIAVERPPIVVSWDRDDDGGIVYRISLGDGMEVTRRHEEVSNGDEDPDAVSARLASSSPEVVFAPPRPEPPQHHSAPTLLDFDAEVSVTGVAVVGASGNLDSIRASYGTLASGRIVYRVDVARRWRCVKTFAQLRALVGLKRLTPLSRPHIEKSAAEWQEKVEAVSQADAAIRAVLRSRLEASLLFLETDVVEFFDEGPWDLRDEDLTWVPCCALSDEARRVASRRLLEADARAVALNATGGARSTDVGTAAFRAARLAVGLLRAVAATPGFERLDTETEARLVCGGDGKAALVSRTTPQHHHHHHKFDDGSTGGAWVRLARYRNALLHTSAWREFRDAAAALRVSLPLDDGGKAARAATLVNLHAALATHALLAFGAGSGRPRSTQRCNLAARYLICGDEPVSLGAIEAAVVRQRATDSEWAVLARARLADASDARAVDLRAALVVASGRASGPPLAAFAPRPPSLARDQIRWAARLRVDRSLERRDDALFLPSDLEPHAALASRRSWASHAEARGKRRRARRAARLENRPLPDLPAEWRDASEHVRRRERRLARRAKRRRSVFGGAQPSEEPDLDDLASSDSDYPTSDSTASTATEPETEPDVKNVLDFLAATGGTLAEAKLKTSSVRILFTPPDLRPALRVLPDPPLDHDDDDDDDFCANDPVYDPVQPPSSGAATDRSNSF
ncbi:hypothetical protein CTAYLR_010034 [Chrysophaeum taylorii]|uniref:Uncharacterized protein n=1 Tax=Chrysophaeum taylorii TaxID=2483200 RepID=A0AAD7UEF0_9STRA|nr:hypothetical protein CTAYLR_010034 [Chrysophaeum taylorii]